VDGEDHGLELNEGKTDLPFEIARYIHEVVRVCELLRIAGHHEMTASKQVRDVGRCTFLNCDHFRYQPEVAIPRIGTLGRYPLKETVIQLVVGHKEDDTQAVSAVPGVEAIGAMLQSELCHKSNLSAIE
jgi:hypothetical protein